MGVGHAAVALGAAKAAPRLNVGWLIFAAFLADFLLGIFAALGLEHATVPPDYPSRHYLLFTFPYSHGLLPLVIWAVIFGGIVASLQKTPTSSSPAAGPQFRAMQKRVFVVIAALVLSHYVLDGLVHVAGLPIAGENSPKLGLGLWKHMPLELTLETAMTLAGIIVYFRAAAAAASPISRWGIGIFMLLLTGLTWTQLLSTKAPEPAELVPTWIAAPLVLSAIPYVFDRKRLSKLAADF